MRIVFGILVVLILPGCLEQTDCLLNNTNMMKIALKGKTLGKDTTVAFISIRDLKDSTLLYSNKALATLEVPLNTSDSTTTFVFQYFEKKILPSDTLIVSDTLVVRYRNELRVISIDCGAYLYQKYLEVPRTNFDNARVISSTLLTTNTKDLEIFL